RARPIHFFPQGFASSLHTPSASRPGNRASSKSIGASWFRRFLDFCASSIPNSSTRSNSSGGFNTESATRESFSAIRVGNLYLIASSLGAPQIEFCDQPILVFDIHVLAEELGFFMITLQGLLHVIS